MVQFQQMKLAEELELANGMALRNATLEQLCHEIKEEEIITVFAKAAGNQVAAWAAKCAKEKQQYPSRTSHVLCAIMYPSHFKLPSLPPCCRNGKASLAL